MTAQGNLGAAGIGGSYPYTGAGGTITISGGTVTATGGIGGAGIGSGYTGAGGTIIISGGTVTATGLNGGAGIGRGEGSGGAGGTVTITGGTVTATGGNLGGAGIGGGSGGTGAAVTINGGTVTATGGVAAAGIGGGIGAGIGGGGAGGGGTITITGGTVTATGNNGGAGIGGGGNTGAGGNITITGGTVTATGSNEGAGIGGGKNGNGGTVNINGGTVTAQGGGSGGAGIGNGSGGSSGGTLGMNGNAVVVANSVNASNTLTKGITVIDNNGKVHGAVELDEDVTFPSTATVLIPSGTSLTVPNSKTLTNNGTIINDGTLTNDGTIANNGTLTNNGTYSGSGALSGSGTINRKLSGTVSISGNAVFGGTLTAVTSSLTASPALADLTTLAYEWKRGGTPIDGANSTTYALVEADIGQTITVSVSGSNTITSTPTSAVDKISVTNAGSTTTVTYDGSTIDLSTLFTIDDNAGAATYSIETGTTGTGSIGGSILTVTVAGTFKIGLVTDATSTYAAGEKVIATLTVDKASSGLSATDLSVQVVVGTSGSTLSTDLSGITLAPTDHGTVTYTLGTFTTNDGVLSTAPTLNGDGHTLEYGYDATSSSTGHTSTQAITITTANYEDISANVVFEVTSKTSVTISNVSVSTKTYDRTPIAASGSAIVTGGTAEKALIWLYTGTETDGTSYSNAAPPTKAGTYNLNISTDPADVVSGSADIPFTINKLDLTHDVTVTPTKVYDGTAAATHSGDLTNIGSDNVTLSAVLTYAAGEDVQTSGNITASTWSISGADADNYTLPSFIAQSANITQKPIIITVNNQSDVTYGTLVTPSYTANLSPLYDTDVFTGDLVIDGARSTSDNLTEGSHSIIQGTLAINDGNGGANYDVSFVGDNFTVNKLDLTHNVVVTPTKVYDGTATATHSGDLTNVIGGDGVTLTAVLTYAAGADVQTSGNITASTWSISGADADNYALPSFIAQSANITAKPQTITFTPSSTLSLESDTYTLVATTENGVSVKFRISGSTAAADIDASQNTLLHLYQSGDVTVTAYIDDSNYQVADVSRTITVESNNTDVSAVAVSGVTPQAGKPDFYLADCGTTSVQIAVTLEESGSQVNYNGTVGSSFSVDISRPDIHEVAYTVQSTDGSTKPYTLQIERPFAFTDIVGTKFNNVLYVNNNPANNGGYKFTNYQWYKDGHLIGDEQVYSAGNSRTDLLDPAADYSVAVTTVDGKLLHVCPDKVTLESVSSLRAYPNPVAQGAQVTLESPTTDGRQAHIYNLSGELIGSGQTLGGKVQFTAPQAAGVYLLTVDGKTVKVVVK
ncbi:hypothetical protein FACS1894195_4030 [Bacteroidia bacterium]|nr:hypothetical protein FACS1894195_4030 [Bacteroidia bacterium]